MYKMSTTVCEPDKHEYQPCYIDCSDCNKGYAICSNCDGDGSCIEDVCDKGLIPCPTQGCKYGFIYKTHHCIKCSKTRYIK